MKHNKQSKIGYLVLIVLFLNTCNNNMFNPSPAEKGKVTVTVTGNARALVPDNDLVFTKYEFLFYKGDGQDHFESGAVDVNEMGEPVTYEIELEDGEYRVLVRGYITVDGTGNEDIDGTQLPAAEGEQTFTVKGESASVIVDIKSGMHVAGDGYLDWRFTLDDVDFADVSIIDLLGNNEEIKSWTITDNDDKGITAIPSGYYLLVIRYDERARAEVLHIYAGQTTFVERTLAPFFQVTFDSTGGSTVNPVWVVSGDTLKAPADPTKDGYEFVDWYDNNDFDGEPYNFDDPLTGYITLYAKWSEIMVSEFFVDDVEGWNNAISAINRWGSDLKEYTINIEAKIDGAPGFADGIFTFGSVTDISVTITGKHTITLAANEKGSLLRINREQTVTLHDVDLEGHHVNDRPLVYVEGSLTMTGNASVTGNRGNNNGGGVFIWNGAFTMSEDSSVFDNGTTGDHSLGGGVNVSGNGSTFIMQDDSKVYNNKVFEGRLEKGGGVYVHGGATFTMRNNASIYGNIAENGGGVYISFSRFNMEGGRIYNNKAGDVSNGGGVYVLNGATFTMSGGEVYNNEASIGGGVFINIGCTFNMEGGTVSGNTATSSGGGLAVSGTGIINIKGGQVYNNTAYQGGGIFIGNGTFRLISGTVVGSTSYNDLYANTVNNAGTAALFSINGTATYGGTNGTDYYFGPTDVNFGIDRTIRGDGVEPNFRISTPQGWEDAINEITNDESYIINITSDITIAGTTNPTFDNVTGINVTITGNHEITLDGTGHLLNIIAGQTVTLRDVGLVGHDDNNNSLVKVAGANAVFIMEGNASVSDNGSDSFGGGVIVENYAGFTMQGNASVFGNRSDSGGGGVYILPDGVFTMKGGGITGNTAPKGGGVFVMNTGTFDMHGGIISGNTADGTPNGNTDGSGGGVFVLISGIFNKKPLDNFSTVSGIIYGNDVNDPLNNKAYQNFGHAVYIERETTAINSFSARGRNSTADEDVHLGSDELSNTVMWDWQGGS